MPERVWRASHGLDTAYNATAPPPVSFTDSMNSEYRSSCYHNFRRAFSVDSINLKQKSYVINQQKYREVSLMIKVETTVASSDPCSDLFVYTEETTFSPVFERLLCPFSEGNSTERKIHRG